MNAKKLFNFDQTVSLALCLPFLWLAICLPMSGAVGLRILCLFHVLFTAVVFGVSKTAYKKACRIWGDEVDRLLVSILAVMTEVADLCGQVTQSQGVVQRALELRELADGARKEFEQKMALSAEAQEAAALTAARTFCQRKNAVELIELWLVSMVAWWGVEDMSVTLWGNEVSWCDLFGIFLILSGVKNIVVYCYLKCRRPKKYSEYLSHFSEDGKCAYGNLLKE